MADSASFIGQLDINLPTNSATLSTAASRWQHLKRTIKTTLPNLGSEASATPAELNHTKGLTANLQTQLNSLRITKLEALSSSVQTQAEALRVGRLSRSGTAIDALLWGGSGQHFQTATPTTSVIGSLWLRL